MAGESQTIIAMLSGLAQALPPNRPFNKGEIEMIEVPLQETLYKYGSNVDPAVSLTIALGMVAFLRWQEYRAIAKTYKGATGESKIGPAPAKEEPRA